MAPKHVMLLGVWSRFCVTMLNKEELLETSLLAWPAYLKTKGGGGHMDRRYGPLPHDEDIPKQGGVETYPMFCSF